MRISSSQIDKNKDSKSNFEKWKYLAREIKYSRDRTENGKRAEIAEGSPKLTFDYKNEHNLKINSRVMSRLTLKEFLAAFKAFERVEAGTDNIWLQILLWMNNKYYTFFQHQFCWKI